MLSCCDRASQEELVLPDASHNIKAADVEPGPAVVETCSFPIADLIPLPRQDAACMETRPVILQTLGRLRHRPCWMLAARTGVGL